MTLQTAEPPSDVMGRQSTEPEVKTSWVRRVRQRLFRRRILMAIGLALATYLFLQSISPTARRALAASLFENRAVIVSLVLFTLVTLSLLWSAGQEWDAALFRFFNAQRKHLWWLDPTMWLLTQLGNMGVALGIAALLYWRDRERLAIELVFGLFTLWFVVETIKALADRARPFASLKDVRIIGWRALGRSFPSGHTAQVFFITSLFVNQFQIIPIVSVVLFVIAGLVGVTRMYVGAHYPRDVIGGALIGTVWGIFGVLVDPYLWLLPA